MSPKNQAGKAWTVLTLTVALLIVVPQAARAGERAERASRPQARAAAAELLDWMAQAWSSLSNAWQEIGCELDPNGTSLTSDPAPAPTSDPTPTGTTTQDVGSELDPNG
jgi:hypothetical protein